MNRKALGTIGGAAFGVLAITGCTFTASANLTAAPETLESAVATELQAEAGTEFAPNIDCGEEQIDLVADERVDCLLSVDGDDSVYDVDVVITSVEGTEFEFEAQVAAEPRA